VNSYYFDTSALVKYYAQEVGTSWVFKICDAPQESIVATSRVTKAEAAAAFARKYRQGELLAEDYARVMDKITDDFLWRYVLVEVTPEVVDLATNLITRHKLRGYDAIHLASGLTLNSILAQTQFTQVAFVAADNDLLIAAKQEQLLVENPIDHLD